MAKLTLSLAALALISACTKAKVKPAERPLTRVEIESVRLGDITDTLTLNAEIRPAHSTQLAAGSGGKIGAMLVEEGDHVPQGKLLARVAAGLASARLAQATAARESASNHLRRVEHLSSRDLASSATIEQARANLAQAEAAYAMAKVRSDDALVRAPHAGVIAKRYRSAGEHAAPGSPLFDLVDISAVDAVAQVPERDAPLITIGQQTQLTADAWPDQAFQGIITRIGIVASLHSRTFDLVIRIDNPDEKLRPGMLTRVSLVRSALHNVPVVRRDAIVEGAQTGADETAQAVFVEQGGKVVLVPVSLGPIENNRVAITDGIAAGAHVVVVGQRTLSSGEAVVVARDHSASAPLAESAHPAAPAQ